MPGTPPKSPDDILRELGLQRYEARCFVALARLPDATAREISEVADVPRTRVYDAVDQLEAEGLVDVQHSSPQRFRAIPVEQAVALLRERFDERFDRLLAGLEALETADSQPNNPAAVWTTTGREAVDTRVIEFVDAATDEVILVVNDGEGTADRVLDRLRAATERDVRVVVGTLTDAAAQRVRRAVPDAEFLDSEVGWLRPPMDPIEHATDGDGHEDRNESANEAESEAAAEGRIESEPETETETETEPEPDTDRDAVFGRIVVADRSAVVLSSLSRHDDELREHALWCAGLGNGLVMIARRLLIAGLEPNDSSSQ